MARLRRLTAAARPRLFRRRLAAERLFGRRLGRVRGFLMCPAAPAEALGRAEFPIWGGHAVVAVTDQAGPRAALAHVKRTVAAFDLACSSFREDSELALLNHSPGEDVVVSRLLFDAVREAIRAARLTGGAVDPTVGQVLVAHRINPPLSDQPVRIEPAPGYTVVKLNEPRLQHHAAGRERSSTSAPPPRRSPPTRPRGRARRGRLRRARRALRRHRGRRRRPRGWLADPCHRRPPPRRRSRPDGRDPGRWSGHLVGDRAPLRRRARTPSIT